MRIHRATMFAGVVVALMFASAAAAQIGKFRYEQGKGTVVLAGGGQAQAVIVIPEQAPPPVQFAAEELKEHLDGMTGGDFRIVTQRPAGGAAIVLGDTAEARAAGIQAQAIARDGYEIRTVGQTLFVAGRDDATAKSQALLALKTQPFPRTASRYEMERRFGEATWDFERGTLYGVYRLLEELGVRWFYPGPKGVVLPRQPDLSVRAFSLSEEPVYLLRKVGTTTWQWYMLGAEGLKDVVNTEEYEELAWGGDVLRLWLLRMRHSSEWFAFNHRPPRLELEQRYGQEHPEYFALRENGQRDLAPQPGRTGHLCYTHPGVLELTKRDIDAYFGGKTGAEMGFTPHTLNLNTENRGWSASAIYGRTVSLLPHDSFRACECPECQKFVHKDREPDYMNSELIWQFIEKMAKWMEQAHPDKLITCLAYSSYSERPDQLKSLPNNVIVGMCPANYARTHNDLTEEHYADLMRMVGEWSAVNERPMLIWLHHLYRHRAPRREGVPMLLTGFSGKLFRDLAAHANLMHIEMDADSIMLEHLNRYVMMKLLYNPNLDPAALVEDYAKRCYGPGGEIALALLKDVEARSMEVGRTEANSIDTWEKIFTEDTVKTYRRQADEMVKLAAGTPYAERTAIFAKWFVGEIAHGRELYVRHVKSVADTAGASVSIRALVGDIKVDGKLDEEGWARSAVVTFGNNISGEKTQWPTHMRFLRHPGNLYFGFTCHDPNAANLPTGLGEADSVEIFLDPDHGHERYYWLWIDLGGRIEDWYFEGGGEPPDKTWDSKAEVAVQRYADHYVVEVRLPRASLDGGRPDPSGRPWGANFGRSCLKPPQPQDAFSCWSPLLRGKFHQPDLFGHIFFVK